MTEAFDILVIGSGPAGAAAAARLAADTKASICVLEAGGDAIGWRGRLPMWQAAPDCKDALDWGRASSPQAGLGGRSVAIALGRGLGGSDLLAPPLWQRGAPNDFDRWTLPDWNWAALLPSLRDAEGRLRPTAAASPHGLSNAFAQTEGAPAEPPEPDRTGLGLLPQTIANGRRLLVSDMYLAPLIASGRVSIASDTRVARVLFSRWRAAGVELVDGRRLRARGGVVLCAGAVETPAILLRSGVGPSDRLRALGIQVAADAPQVGENLQVRPMMTAVHLGPHGGAGYDWRQMLKWLGAAAVWGMGGDGPLGLGLTEAGGFLRAGVGSGPPDIELRLRLAQPAWPSGSVFARPGLTLEARICRPRSVGRVGLAGVDPRLSPRIDPALMAHEDDRALMRVALRRMRGLIDREEFDGWRDAESVPGRRVSSEEALAEAVARRVTSSGEMAGSCHMGVGESAPVDPQMRVRGIEGAWVCDSSVLPTLPSAGMRVAATAAGWHGAGLIALQLQHDLRDAA
ncbi:MAG: choline dehydrogenase [Paracoccaceae bacterium]|jgi:choline dehydrogenase